MKSWRRAPDGRSAALVLLDSSLSPWRILPCCIGSAQSEKALIDLRTSAETRTPPEGGVHNPYDRLFVRSLRDDGERIRVRRDRDRTERASRVPARTRCTGRCLACRWCSYRSYHRRIQTDGLPSAW